MMKCRLAWRSTRNSILPPLMSETALATSGVTVPVLGFGIRPRGPSTRPSRPTLPLTPGGPAPATSPPALPHHVGRGEARVEVEPAAVHLLDELIAADHVGTSLT